MPSEVLRADARRNREVVVETAIRLLAEDPDPSVAEIADEAGLARMTVYRHFPSRDDLIEAIIDRVDRIAKERIAEIVQEDPPLAEGLGEISAMMAELGDEYGFLLGFELNQGAKAQRAVDPDDPLLQYLARATGRGEARGDYPLAWQARVLHSLIIGACEEQRNGELSREACGELLGKTLVAVFAAR